MPKQRDLNSYFQAIQATTASSSNTQKKSYKVENAFTPVAKDGKYSVVMRFLPSNVNEFRPFIENRNHMFQLKNGSWFGCDCLSKFGKPCPICDYNRQMWKEHPGDDYKNYSLGKFKPKYVSNVLIVRNPNAPDTEGKVFRFEYGPLVMKMISEVMTDHEDPEAGTVKGFNPFDWKTGANFVFEGISAGKYMKNDTSHFGSPKPINRWDGSKFVELTDEEIDDIESKLFTLDDCEHKESDVRSYDEILAAYEKKNGAPLFGYNGAPAPAASTPVTVSDESIINIFDDEPAAPKAEPAPKAAAATADDEPVINANDFFAQFKKKNV